MRHICCGALNAYIVRGDNPDATAVAARIGRGELWCFLPFGQVPADRLAAVDETRFLALSRAREGEPKWMAVFDAEHRSQASPTIDVKDLSAEGKLLVTRARDRVVYFGAGASICWSFSELSEVWRCDLPGVIAEDAAERDDGGFIVKARRRSPGEPEGAVVLTLSADGALTRVHEAGPLAGLGEHDAFALSDAGKWLCRPHRGAVLLTDGRGSPLADLARLALVDDAQLIEVLKRVWIHGAHELWSADSMDFHARIVVRSIPLFEALAEKPSEEAVHALHRLHLAQQGLGELEKEGADEDELVAARAEIGRLRKLQNDFARARATLRRLARCAELAPYEAWRPDDPALPDRLPPAEAHWARAIMQVLEVAHGSVQGWDAGDQAFVVTFPDRQRRRVAANGGLGELETAPPAPGERGAPADVKAPALHFLRSASVSTMRLGRLDEYNCVRAIEDIIARIRKGAHSVVWGRRLTLRFALPDGELSERQFFDFVGANCENAVLSLRHLLAAYDQAAKSNDVWSEDGVAALGYAALALARLDPEAYTALEGYFTRRDAREDRFAGRELLPAIADRTGSFATLGALRFALMRLADEELEAGRGAPLATRIIAGARICCSPAAFRREIERAARTLMWRAEIETQALAGKARIKDVRTQMAAAAARVQAGLLTPLLRAADPLEDWDFAFIGLTRRRRSRYPQSPWRWLAAWRRARRAARREAASAPAPPELSGQRRRRHRSQDFSARRRGGAQGPKGIAHDARDEEKVAR